MLNRRRFLTMTAMLALTPHLGQAAQIHVATGVALGAKVALRLSHPDAPAIARRALAEIDRLESVFSLYRPASALSRLNAAGRLDAPPFELLACLSTAAAVHEASGGLFDPSVQPLWRAYADAAEGRHRLTETARRQALAKVGFGKVDLQPNRITLRPGMALTLNGIAQGFIADRVAALLAAEGLTDVLIDTGEMVALGGVPQGDGWPVQLQGGGQMALRGRALATSAPLGMTFGADPRASHILDPRSGRTASLRWHSISLSAPSAALADALATTACLMPDQRDILLLCERFPGVRIERATSL